MHAGVCHDQHWDDQGEQGLDGGPQFSSQQVEPEEARRVDGESGVPVRDRERKRRSEGDDQDRLDWKENVIMRGDGDPSSDHSQNFSLLAGHDIP